MSPPKNLHLKALHGRKPFSKLISSRQRIRRLNLLRNNKKLHNKRLDNPAMIDDTMNDSYISETPMTDNNEYDCSFNHDVSKYHEISSDHVIDVENCNFSNLQIQRNFSPVTCQFNDNHSLDAEDVNNSFQESLARAFIQGNLTHTQGNLILKTLRSLPCLSYLPKSSRTLLNTPRKGPIITKVDPGEYIHIGFGKALLRILQRTSPNLIPNIIEVDFSTDGAKLNKSGYSQIWPIQCSIANIANSKPEVVGIYKGPSKPRNIDTFFTPFIDDVLKIIDSGVLFLEKKIFVKLRSFIADAPARSWALNHFGHTSSNPCSKCRVIGTRYEGQIIFMGINHRLRTDEEYSMLDDEDHHKGPTPLTRLPMGMVSQVPFDYMHLVCIGVVKKLIIAWVTGKYGKKMKLAGRNQNVISRRLEHIAQYCPREFARKPRSLSDYKDYKATEGRQFILYTGPICLRGMMEEQGYMHFLLLHAAIRALCHSSISQKLLFFAKLALEKFVEICPKLYKRTFLSYNVHALLHLSTDVEHLGPLDSFSAFPYENNISFFQKYYRKPHRPLQQFFYREAEKEREKLKPLIDTNIIKLFGRHNKGPLPLEFLSHNSQYKKLKTRNMYINVDSLSDRCCILCDLSVCIVYNILEIDNLHYFVLRKFELVEDFYDVGIPSSFIGIFKCSVLCNNFKIVSINEVKAKCYLMPYWSINDDEGSDCSASETNEIIEGKYIVSVLL